MREPINVIDRFVVEEVAPTIEKKLPRKGSKDSLRSKSNGYTSPYAAKSFKKMRNNSTIPVNVKSTTSLRKPKNLVSPIPRAVRTRKLSTNQPPIAQKSRRPNDENLEHNASQSSMRININDYARATNLKKNGKSRQAVQSSPTKRNSTRSEKGKMTRT